METHLDEYLMMLKVEMNAANAIANRLPAILFKHTDPMHAPVRPPQQSMEENASKSKSLFMISSKLLSTITRATFPRASPHMSPPSTLGTTAYVTYPPYTILSLSVSLSVSK